MTGRLWIREAPGTIRELHLESCLRDKRADDEPGLVIGRDSAADIVLADIAVSRFHARLVPTQGGWKVVDLDSSNKTYVNGDPIREAELAPGDHIGIGDCEIHLLAEIARSSAEATRTQVLGRFGSGSPSTTAGDQARDVLGALHRLTTEIANLSNPDEILDRGVRVLVEELSVDRGAALMLDGDALLCRAAHSGSGQALRGFILSQTIYREVLQSREAILSRDTTEDSRFSDRASIVGEEIRSVIAAPIRRGSEIAGILYLDRLETQSEAFGQQHLEGVAVAAEILGSAMLAGSRVYDLEKERESLVQTIIDTNPIIGTSHAIQRVREFIRRAAPTDSTVLVLGETGTGKELVASAIHYQSHRRTAPFITINCAAIPETLVESELFGHERGAFTGAVARKKGKFEAAHQGTIFLDEVGELPLGCQAKLLRLLEERCFERVGGTESVEVDVRIVAATNRNLEEEIKESGFREDLYYRLNVLQVNVPPLRERTGDLELLLDHFLDHFSQRIGVPRKSLSVEAREQLLNHPWPGNVRQLRNCVESAVVMSLGECIELSDLPPTAASQPRVEGPVVVPWQPRSIQEVEKEHIARVLHAVKWNKSKAAEMLGIERSTLYARIKNYDLKPGE